MAKDVVITLEASSENVAWHAIDTADNVLQKLNSGVSGLSSAEADGRLKQYGPNRLTPPKKAGFLAKLWAQLNNVLIFVLVTSAIVCSVLGEWAEVGLILGVIVINVAIGLVQEGKAEKAADAIKAMLSSSASVFRNGERTTVGAESLVPGDVVVMKSGDKVPADIRLLEVCNFQVLEAMLTGESVPVSKNLIPVAPSSALGDRKCMAYSATTVMAGQAKGVVVATGDSAEIGKISKMVSEVEVTRTNLMIQLEILARWISICVIFIGVASFFLARYRQHEQLSEAVKVAISIAVAIIPEGLPAVVTICLAIGTTVMARNNAIIRQLPAVETLGSLNVICSDKTGTLTKNEMTAVAMRTAAGLVKITGVGYAPTGTFTTQDGQELPPTRMEAVRKLLQGGVLCNDSALTKAVNVVGKEDWAPQGAPTEVALITAAAKAGIDVKALSETHPRIASVPFESEHKFMATMHQEGGQRVMYVKGAPERLLPICCSQVANDDIHSTEEVDVRAWLDAQAELSSQGLRVLAVCRYEVPEGESLEGLTPLSILQRPPFLSMVVMMAILDPPREEVIEAIHTAHRAGINVKMITGDHALTAMAIGRMLNILGDGKVYTGPEVDAMSDEQLVGVVSRCNIFARASPENKLRIVRALQTLKQFVAMTGDGVNDAPALKAANIGVAMGITGTDVSKEAAKMVLADDNFATIVAAVREGRRVWDNLRKILLFNMPVNFAQGCCIMWAYVIGMDHAPMTAIQVLYINLVTSVAMGIMLCMEPAEPTVMDHPPRRPGKRLMGKLIIWRSFSVSTILNVFIVGFFQWGKVAGYSLAQRRAETFNTLAFGEIGYCLTTRFIKASTLHPRALMGNKWCFVAIGFTAGMQVLLTYTPILNDFFSMSPMDGLQWARVLSAMVATYLIVELEKALVDPLLMPLVRPLINFVDTHTPKWLGGGYAEEKAKERAAAAASAAKAKQAAVDATQRLQDAADSLKAKTAA